MSMMVDGPCGAKSWTLVNGKWKEHSCIKQRVSTHQELAFSDEEKHMTLQYIHKCECGYKWRGDKTPDLPWKKNLPSKEEIHRQMAELIGR